MDHKKQNHTKSTKTTIYLIGGLLCLVAIGFTWKISTSENKTEEKKTSTSKPTKNKVSIKKEKTTTSASKSTQHKVSTKEKTTEIKDPKSKQSYFKKWVEGLSVKELLKSFMFANGLTILTFLAIDFFYYKIYNPKELIIVMIGAGLWFVKSLTTDSFKDKIWHSFKNWFKKDSSQKNLKTAMFGSALGTLVSLIINYFQSKTSPPPPPSPHF